MHQSGREEEEELEVTNEDFNFPALKDKSADSVTAEQVTGQQLPDRRVQEHHEYVSLDCGRAGLHSPAHTTASAATLFIIQHIHTELVSVSAAPVRIGSAVCWSQRCVWLDALS